MVLAITVLHVLVCLFLILVVLLQAGKGGGMAAFGGSSTGSVFGGGGGNSLLVRITTGCAVVFMATSMVLAYMASAKGSEGLRRFSDEARAKKEAKEQAERAIQEGAAPLPEAGAVAPEVEGAQAPEGAAAPEGVAPVPGAAPAEGDPGAGEIAPPQGAAPSPSAPTP